MSTNNEVFITYYRNGNKCEEYNIIDGKIEGNYFHYYLDGRVYIFCNFLNNKKHGELEIYNTEGHLIKKINYNNGYIINKI